MINWFKEINYFYNTKINGERLWEINRVKDAISLNKITLEQFKEITGQDYIN